MIKNKKVIVNLLLGRHLDPIRKMTRCLVSTRHDTVAFSLEEKDRYGSKRKFNEGNKIGKDHN